MHLHVVSLFATVVGLAAAKSLSFAMDNWSAYPSVPKTASINGFADPIYEKLPECAKLCVSMSASNLPCPYWDTGCLCVWWPWSQVVALCIANACRGEDVAKATSLAYSLCNSVGASVWNMPSSVSSALSLAASTFQVSASTTGKSPWSNSKSLSLIMATAKTEDATRSGPASSSSNGAAIVGGADFGVVLLVLSLLG